MKRFIRLVDFHSSILYSHIKISSSYIGGFHQNGNDPLWREETSSSELPVGFTFRSGSYTWLSKKVPSSRLSVLSPLFLISIASRTSLDLLLCSRPNMVASSQSMTWFALATWSEIADLVCSCCEAFLSDPDDPGWYTAQYSVLRRNGPGTAPQTLSSFT